MSKHSWKTKWFSRCYFSASLSHYTRKCLCLDGRGPWAPSVRTRQAGLSPSGFCCGLHGPLSPQPRAFQLLPNVGHELQESSGKKTCKSGAEPEKQLLAVPQKWIPSQSRKLKSHSYKDGLQVLRYKKNTVFGPLDPIFVSEARVLCLNHL